jgi:hypothetical protein
VWLHVWRRTDLHPAAILRIQEASGVFSLATVIFKKLSFYKANPEWVSGIQFWDLKIPKMALADCSGVGDAVIAKPPGFQTEADIKWQQERLVAEHTSPSRCLPRFQTKPDVEPR